MLFTRWRLPASLSKPRLFQRTLRQTRDITQPCGSSLLRATDVPLPQWWHIFNKQSLPLLDCTHLECTLVNFWRTSKIDICSRLHVIFTISRHNQNICFYGPTILWVAVECHIMVRHVHDTHQNIFWALNHHWGNKHSFSTTWFYGKWHICGSLKLSLDISNAHWWYFCLFGQQNSAYVIHSGFLASHGCINSFTILHLQHIITKIDFAFLFPQKINPQNQCITYVSLHDVTEVLPSTQLKTHMFPHITLHGRVFLGVP